MIHFFFPSETIVGMSNIFVHYDESIFPEPYKFKPERWLDPSSENLDAWLVAFAKGPRSCLGIKCVPLLPDNVIMTYLKPL